MTNSNPGQRGAVRIVLLLVVALFPARTGARPVVVVHPLEAYGTFGVGHAHPTERFTDY